MVTDQKWTPYCGQAPDPGEWLTRWNFDPAFLLVLLACTAVGWRFLHAEASLVQRRCFLAAMLLLVVLFVTPFCALTSALFSARVVHHVALTTLVAPLLARSADRPSGMPVSLAMWTAVQAIVFWAWHGPPLYALALSNDVAYWLMQASLLASATAFWIAIRRTEIVGATVALLATMVQMGLLGALLTFITEPLYAPHWTSTAAWGLSPLEDQQLAGVVMWAPAAGLYLAAMLLLVGRWFRRQTRPAAAC